MKSAIVECQGCNNSVRVPTHVCQDKRLKFSHTIKHKSDCIEMARFVATGEVPHIFLHFVEADA